ncbi:MAG: SET domain-containing protein-lysine N-methyltransferase [Flavobacteriales bacterium CG18_big_fil_WC_8_21_14_2_50_32_9]|nr:SET domain-containing protein [Flavobacteriales bacterium]PIQ16614.1 MAG: SET domain-containing protein-lysine N-methyltransferase [Flavobacteriales bacterium CG18_big_fil_WC_8_21_14_2_50_32_9]
MLETNNTIDADEVDYLYVSLSQLPNAGNGLFTAIDIYKDEVISIFKGLILTEFQIKHRVGERKDNYFISLLDGTIMDSMTVDCFAKYANDVKGSLTTKLNNNSKIAINDNNAICLIATRKIKSGEELFCSYGARYWKKHGN